MLSILYFTLVLLFFGLLRYYLIFNQLNTSPNPSINNKEDLTVSLIICAKNEYKNLIRFSPYWLSQKEIRYELIIVNDESTDNTASFLTELAQRYDFVKVINITSNPTNLKGKRNALLEGIRAATSPYVVLTDADCKPSSDFWLRDMRACFDDNTDIVLGYSPYIATKGLLNALIQYETTLSALLYLSAANRCVPYMGVGRNIAYRKSVLTNDIVYKSNKTIGGDDDLMLNQLATPNNTKIQLSKNSFVYSVPESNFANWFNQKTRHYNTAKHYKKNKLFYPSFFNALNIAFYFVLLILIFKGLPWFVIIFLYFLKKIAFICMNYKVLNKLNYKIHFFHSIYIDFVHFLLLLITHIKALLNFDVWQQKYSKR